MPFFLNFIQAPLSIVSFCVRDVFSFQLTDGEELLAILYSYDLVLCFDMHCFLRSFGLFLAFWLSILGMGSFIYIILFTLLPFHRSFAVTPLGHF